MQERARWQRDRHAATVEAVLDALSPDPVLAGLCAELTVSALSAAALPIWLGSAMGTLHGGVLPRTVAALEASQGLRPGELEAIEAALAPAGDELLRRLALAALRGQRWLGWTAARLARLEAFRADPSPMVAEAAQFTFPPGETLSTVWRSVTVRPLHHSGLVAMRERNIDDLDPIELGLGQR